MAEHPAKEGQVDANEEPGDSTVDTTEEPEGASNVSQPGPLAVGNGTDWGLFGVGILLGGAAGVGIALLMMRRRETAGEQPTARVAPPPQLAPRSLAASAPPIQTGPAASTTPTTPPPPTERRSPYRPPPELLDAVIDSRDRTESSALRDTLGRGLASAGVEEISPAPGERFDVEIHEATLAVTTDDAAADLTIAALESPGYRSDDGVIRPARVQVFRAGGTR